MKQYISKEQFKELFKRNLWTQGAKYWSQTDAQLFNNEFFTVGQMIAFLNEKDNNALAHLFDVRLANTSPSEEPQPVYIDVEGLCDDLWEAVIEVLEDETREEVEV